MRKVLLILLTLSVINLVYSTAGLNPHNETSTEERESFETTLHVAASMISLFAIISSVFLIRALNVRILVIYVSFLFFTAPHLLDLLQFFGLFMNTSSGVIMIIEHVSFFLGAITFLIGLYLLIPRGETLN